MPQIHRSAWVGVRYSESWRSCSPNASSGGGSYVTESEGSAIRVQPDGRFTDWANGFLCVLESSWRLCGSGACVGASRAIATADTAQQATAPATIPNGES